MCKPSASTMASGHRGSAVNGRVSFCTAHTFAALFFQPGLPSLPFWTLLAPTCFHFFLCLHPSATGGACPRYQAPGQSLGCRDEWDTIPALKDLLALCVEIDHYNSLQ